MKITPAEIMGVTKDADKKVLRIRDAITFERRGVAGDVHAIYASRETAMRNAGDMQAAVAEGDPRAASAHYESMGRSLRHQAELEAGLVKRLDTTPKFMEEFAELANVIMASAPLMKTLWELMPELSVEAQRKLMAALPGVSFNE